MVMDLIFGTKGTGKTTLALHLLSKQGKPRLIIDPIGEHKGEVVCRSLRELLNACDTGRVDVKTKCTVLQSWDDAEDYEYEMWIFIQKLRGWSVMVDEVDRFCSPQWMPRPMDKLFNGQLHYGVDLICCSRRPAKIHNDLTSLTDKIWIFRMIGTSDLQYVRETAGRGCAEAVKVLDDHDYYELTPPLVAWD